MPLQKTQASPSYRITSERNSLLSRALFAAIAQGMTPFVTYIGKAGQGNSSHEKQTVAAIVRTASEKTHLSNNIIGLYFTRYLK